MKTALEPKYKKRIGYQAALLGGFATLASILLVMGNIATKDDIILRQKEDLQLSLAQVMPAERYTNNLLESPLQLDTDNANKVMFYRGIKDQKVTSLAWEISGIGYSGEMRFILSVDSQGNILGVRVLSHSETPGLGDKMEVEKDDWILGFNGLSLKNTPLSQWKVKKDGGQFDAFSGATITPRAVVLSIVTALKFFNQHKKELLDISKFNAQKLAAEKNEIEQSDTEPLNIKNVNTEKAIKKKVTLEKLEIDKKTSDVSATNVTKIETSKIEQINNKAVLPVKGETAHGN